MPRYRIENRADENSSAIAVKLYKSKKCIEKVLGGSYLQKRGKRDSLLLRVPSE